MLHLIDERGGPGGCIGVDAGLVSRAAELAVSHEAPYCTVAILCRQGRLVRRPGSRCLARPRA